MPLNLIFIQPGNYTIDDNGIPGDNISVIRDGNGVVIFTFAHPADALGFTVSTPGVNITVNFTDSMNAANFTIGSTDPDPMVGPPQSPDSIVMENIQTTGTVTLVANGTITEGSNVDAAADITAGALVMSAVSGIGTPGNALETRTGLVEAETTTGGINISNFGSVQIGAVTADVDGLDVATSGNIIFVTVGSIFLTEANSLTAGEVVHGGSTSGNVTLTALGANSDIIGNVDNGAVTVPRGSLTMTAGRDIQLGTIGADFNNDIVTSGDLILNAGRDILIDGFADILSDNFGLDTGGDLEFTAGRNIGILNVAGVSASATASGSGGGDAILIAGGTLTVNGPGSFALGSTSGEVVILADRILIDAGSGISAPSGTITLRTATDGRPILLGSATDAAFALELSDVELNRLFTPDLTIGADDAGPIRIISPIALVSAGSPADVTLRSATRILVESNITVLDQLSLIALDDVFQSASSTITGTSLVVQADAVNDDPNVGGVVTLNGTIAAAPIAISGNGDRDTLNGSAQADTLIGLGGNDRLDGNGGDDILKGGLGADKLVGDGGIDTVDYSGDAGAVSVNLTTNLGQLNSAEGDVYSEIENVNGTEFSDVITGSALANVINGNGGNDRIKGNAGPDIMNGGLGIDTADYSGNFGAVSIDLAAGTGQFNFAQGDVLAGFENVRGTEFNDTLTGDGGDNRLEGNGGDDELIGGGGNDNLIGGLGADVHDGGAGVDTANYSGNFGAVSVNLFTGVGLSNYAQGDTYISIEKVIGTDFNDIFESNGVTNVFTGGLGNDTFIFRPGFSEDIITDFAGNGAAAGDVIRFRTGVFTDFADMLASASQQGADVVIEADPSNILILQNVLLGDLHSSDFIFG